MAQKGGSVNIRGKRHDKLLPPENFVLTMGERPPNSGQSPEIDLSKDTITMSEHQRIVAELVKDLEFYAKPINYVIHGDSEELTNWVEVMVLRAQEALAKYRGGK